MNRNARVAHVVDAIDEQDDEQLDLDRLVGLAHHVLSAEGVRPPAELSLLFVGRTTMSGLNRTHMGVDGPTDVLAFPIDDDPGERGRFPDGGTGGPDRDTTVPEDLPLLLGDVVVCPAVAAAQAADQDPPRAASWEVEMLVVHGILHVLGMDHVDAAEEAAMTARTTAHLSTFAASPLRSP